MTPSRPTSLAGGDLHVGEDGLEVRQLDGGSPRAGASTPGRRGGHGHRGRGANIITIGVTVNLSVCCLSHLLLVVLGLLSAGCLDLVLPVPTNNTKCKNCLLL